MTSPLPENWVDALLTGILPKEEEDEWPMRYIDGNRSHDPFKDIKLPKKSLFEEKRELALKAYESNQ